MNQNNRKSPDMIALENCFKNLKTKSNVEENLKMISRIVKRNFDIDFKINIVENDTAQFFGMTIYPTKHIIETLINKILNEKARGLVIEQVWSSNPFWVLEIDSILLYDTNLNANPTEMVAILLHEIGHIVYSNSIPQRVNKVLRFQLMDLSLTLKKLIQWRRVQRIFDLVFIEACSTKNYHYINMHTERVADKFVVKMGYGESLDNFITKLINTQGNSLVNRTEDEIENDVETIVTWSVDNISELEFRKGKLRRSLQAEILRNPSPYVRDIIFGIKKSFFGDNQDTYKEVVAEQYLITDAKQVIKEGLLDIFDKYGKVKKITQSDIDILSVEINRIENNDDKIYVLDLIYDKLDVINAALAMIAENKKDKVPVSKDTLLNYKGQLEKLRKQVLDLQIKDKTYGVFIKYPKGYEG